MILNGSSHQLEISVSTRFREIFRTIVPLHRGIPAPDLTAMTAFPARHIWPNPAVAG